eukprot:3933662-Pleurochrysis_carterae.AAC.1
MQERKGELKEAKARVATTRLWHQRFGAVAAAACVAFAFTPNAAPVLAFCSSYSGPLLCSDQTPSPGWIIALLAD